MRKIKKFKIPVHHYDIYRKGKKLKLDIDNSHLEGQDGLKEFVSALACAAEPSTVFDFIKNDSPLWGAVKPGNKQYAATIGLVTLGPAFEEKMASISDPIETEIAKIASFIFLSTGINIVSELVNEEAKNDGFELLKPLYLYSNPPESTIDKEAPPQEPLSPDMLSEIAIKLQADKVGIKAQNGSFFPKYTALFSIPWMIKKKK